ncbi:MAG: protease pro-enzyme activation domain-containing protein [Methanomassiliicoccales archaeon]|nr:protease pro-enzyme activation domain-containing protein [Methanomassiliicoccales archaeon]
MQPQTASASWRYATVVVAAAVILSGLSVYFMQAHLTVRPNASSGLLSEAQLAQGPYVSSGPTELAMLKGSTLVGSVPDSMPMYMTVSFKIRNAQQLATLINEQQTPGSPLYHHFLTLKQFQQSFGPTPQVYDETLSYFTAAGFTQVATGTTMTLAFRANAGTVGNALKTQIGFFRLSNGSMVYSNIRQLSLPAPISSSISSINGLTSIVKIHTGLVHAPFFSYGGGSVTSSASFSSGTSIFSNMSRAVNFTKPGFLYTGASFPYGQWQFLNPSVLGEAYNATPLYTLGDRGQGTTIAVVMAGGYNPSDLSAYSKMVFNTSNQILNRLTPYPVNGGAVNATLPGTRLQTGGDAFEFTLDIEYSATMAPAAHIDAVYGPSLSTASLVSAYAKLTTISPLPNVITNSWGGSEDTWWNLYGPSWQSANALENYFMELTSMGSTILASSGDQGGYDSFSGLLSTSIPASSPYVVAVGGVRTTLSNASGVSFPSPPQYLVNATVAPFGFSEASSYPTWFPNYTLNASTAGNVTANSYWYTPGLTGSSPDFASGGIGLSYWFEQPWWQHGKAVPYTGRRMVPDISAEADFNQTVYFDGAWNFFWGGTSFACPTIAGEFALLDAYLNSTAGNSTNRSGYYLGLAQPLLYNLGNDPHLTLRPYTQIGSGSNPWDIQASAGGLGWPGGQNWPVAYTAPLPGWNLLAGWGVPDVANMVFDASTLLSSSRLYVKFNGTTPTTLPGDRNYVFKLVNSTGAPVSGASVNMTFTSSAGVTNYSVTNTNATGTFSFSASGLHGDLSLYSVLPASSVSGFQSIWISEQNLSSGSISVTVLGVGRSVMGGFDFFNGFLSPNYPALGSLMPNTVKVFVTYRATPTSVPVPVYNAMVIAVTPHEPHFSSPPAYSNPYYQALASLNYTPMRSLSFTNLSGIAYVETWNVPQPENYTIHASYRGLANVTNLTVTPRLNIQSLNAFSSTEGSLFGRTAGYTGNGANNTIIAPSVAGVGDQYTMYVRVTYWNGVPAAFVPVDIASPNLQSPPFSPIPVHGTETITNASGIAALTINYSVSSASQASQGTLLIQAFNDSYPSESILTPSTNLPVLTNDSTSVVLFLGQAFGTAYTTIQLSSGSVLYTPFIGTSGAYGNFFVELPVFSPFSVYNNITALSYSVDGGAHVSVPLPSTGQNSFMWSFPLSGLSIGPHLLAVIFNDSYGFSYNVDYAFYVIGNGTNPGPTVSFSSPAPGSYVSGQTTIDFTITQSQYLLSETLRINQLSYNVRGLTSFTFNASSFGYGAMTVSLTAVNYNGVSASSALLLYSAPQFRPDAAITSPYNGKVFNSTNSVTVGLYYSGDYISSAILHVAGQATNTSYNVTGMSSYTLSRLTKGTYHLTYVVTSTDGTSTISTCSFTVLSTPAETAGAAFVSISPLAGVIMIVLFVAGMLIGLFLDRMRRKPPV